MDTFKYTKLINDANEKRRIELRFNELKQIKEHHGFKSLKELERQGISNELKESRQLNYYEDLSLNQKLEYLDAFYGIKKLTDIKKYSKIRFIRLFQSLANINANYNQLQREINFINELCSNNFSDLIKDLDTSFKIIQSDPNYKNHLKILYFIRTLLGDSGLNIKINLKSNYYVFTYSELFSPKSFVIISDFNENEIRESLEKCELILNHGGFINNLAYMKGIFQFNVSDDYSFKIRCLRLNVIKEAELICQLMEPFCEKIEDYLLTKSSKNMSFYASNISDDFIRLSKAFVTVKQFEKAIEWINRYLSLISNLKSKELLMSGPDSFNQFQNLKIKAKEKLKRFREKVPKRPERPEFMSFDKARAFVRDIGLNSEKEWRKYRTSGNKPNNIPSTPDRVYKDEGWMDWSDWLGYEKMINFKSYEEAKTYVNKLKLSSTKYWKEYCRSGNKPNDIPSSPNIVYKNDGWVDWGDWLGTGINKSNNNPTFLEFEEARLFIRNLRLNSVAEWREYKKSSDKPINIPANPDRVYKSKGWINWEDWLGSGSKSSNSNNFLNFEDARNHSKSLGLNSTAEWRLYKKSGKKPANIPSHPDRVYKDKGWINWADWLGKIN